MNFKFSLRPAGLFLLSAFALICPLAGCGGGGSSIAIAPTSTSAGDIKSSPVPAPANSGGCTASTYTPNFATLIPTYRWSGFPLKVYFSNSGVTTMSDGTQVDLKDVAMTGFSEWITATNSNVTFLVVSDASLANVVVHFGTLPALPTDKDVLGLEQSTLYSDSTMKSADILLNLWPAMTAGNIASFRETSAHEFGHALGLNGHSDSPLDVMYASHPLEGEKTLTARDINTLKTDYCGQFTRAADLPHPTGATRTITNF